MFWQQSMRTATQETGGGWGFMTAKKTGGTSLSEMMVSRFAQVDLDELGELQEILGHGSCLLAGYWNQARPER